MHVAEVRRAFAAGTLGTVGDEAHNGHVERDGVAPDTDGTYGDGVTLIEGHKPWENVHRKMSEWDARQAEAVRQDRLQRWQVPRV